MLTLYISDNIRLQNILHAANFLAAGNKNIFCRKSSPGRQLTIFNAREEQI
jgi:hypothetical protein